VASAEASARTVEAAVAAAAAKLGLRPDQVDVEVLKQPVASTFGKIGEPALVRVAGRETQGGHTEPEVQVQATQGGESVAVAVRPPAVGQETDTRPSGGEAEAEPEPERGRGDGGDRGDHGDGDGDGGRRASSPRRHPEVTDPEAIAADTELAGDFVEGLLDALDVDGDITTWVDVAGGHVDIEGSKLEFLVGREGEILAVLQELTRLAVLRQTQRWVRITVDVNGFKARRREEIAAMAREVAQRVASSGQDEELEPMTSFERKIVHDVIAEVSGAQSTSVGEDPNRRVVIRPA
jgi:spoIIIJ-associated protein